MTVTPEVIDATCQVFAGACALGFGFSRTAV
jgi:hypothetical protein